MGSILILDSIWIIKRPLSQLCMDLFKSFNTYNICKYCFDMEYTKMNMKQVLIIMIDNVNHQPAHLINVQILMINIANWQNQ